MSRTAAPVTWPGRSVRAAAVLLACCAVAGASPRAAGPAGPAGPAAEILAPDEVEGLRAWYRLERLHERMQDGATMRDWPDASGNGHRLVDNRDGVHAAFRTMRVDGKPVVEIRRGNTHAVAEPFELDDHTIVLALASAPSRALFRSDKDPFRGLLLRDRGEHHVYQDGDPGRSFRHCEGEPPGSEFRIQVLTRESGVLGCFLDGADRSTGVEFSNTLRVGTFFHLRATRFVQNDGAGIMIGEMIFYDRALTGEERNGVTAYLGRRYGIEVVADAPVAGEAADPPPVPLPAREEVDVWLQAAGTLAGATGEAASAGEAAGRPVWIRWRAGDVRGPFRLGEGQYDTRLSSTRDGVSARVWAALPLKDAPEGTRRDVLILVNGTHYLEVTGSTPSPATPEPDGTPPAHVTAEVSLDEGDFLEVLLAGGGPAGAPALDLPETVLAVRGD